MPRLIADAPATPSTQTPTDEGADRVLEYLRTEDGTDESITSLDDSSDSLSVSPTNKRKHRINPFENSSPSSPFSTPTRPEKRVRLSHISPPALIYPMSQYDGWRPPLPPQTEADVLSDFRRAERRGNLASGKEYQYFTLDQFCFYRPHVGRFPSECVPLHHFCVQSLCDTLYFDGILDNGSKRYYVQAVPCTTLSIGNYCDPARHEVGDQMWVQSALLDGSATWYQLGNAAPQYTRYHEPFVWLANFAKYFVDYLHRRRRRDVTLHHFQKAFHSELDRLHGLDASYRTWLQAYGDTDFRRVLAANPDFLRNEAVRIDPEFQHHTIWSEISHDPKYLTVVKHHAVKNQSTIVTPFVYECFKKMPWSSHLKGLQAGNTAPHNARSQNTESDYAGSACTKKPWSSRSDFTDKDMTGKPRTIKEGDVIEVKQDADTVWQSTTKAWYAYVQQVDTTTRGGRVLDVIWLYAPADTTCSGMHYPFANELFFSDNCNCNDLDLKAKEVVRRVPVDFFASPDTSEHEFFVRQKYRTVDEAFVTLKKSDLKCKHHSRPWPSALEELMQKYSVGDTVLYLTETSEGKEILEPGEIKQFLEDGASARVRITRLLRRRRDFNGSGQARPNELVYTNDVLSLPADRVVRRCHVRFYTQEERDKGRILPPYDRDGTGDAYYITSRKGQGFEGQLEPLKRPFPSSLIQGFDPAAPPTRPIMSGLDLFCGGGNFGRGLEEGGAVRNRWAVDNDCNAIHTYSANLGHPGQTALYYGSVNDFLEKAINGARSKIVPQPGDVDFISAGSPCQGFSNANRNKTGEKALRNVSLVASVAAFVDFYRPKYALLENVVTMASSANGKRDENVLSQLLCCLVGMGYQVQQFILDAWSFGSPQSRSRLFVSIAAPNLELPPHPGLSHSHPPRTKERALGVAANGVRYGERRFGPTPFQYITAAEGTNDLPHIGDARTQTCIPFPDHRNIRHETYVTQVQLSQVPTAPRGQSFMTAFMRGRLGKPQIEKFSWKNEHKVNLKSRGWQRINPNGLIPTITTAPQPSCSFTGCIVHWDEHRVLTVQEARRAQSFPDRDVIVGKPRVQWKIVGNSVARTVALALGMSLREAWLANKCGDEGRVVPEVVISASDPDALLLEEQLNEEMRRYSVSDDGTSRTENPFSETSPITPTPIPSRRHATRLPIHMSRPPVPGSHEAPIAIPDDDDDDEVVQVGEWSPATISTSPRHHHLNPPVFLTPACLGGSRSNITPSTTPSNPSPLDRQRRGSNIARERNVLEPQRRNRVTKRSDRQTQPSASLSNSQPHRRPPTWNSGRR